MATKTSGKSSSQRPHAQKPSASRKGAASGHGRSSAQSNGKHPHQAKAHPGTQRTGSKGGKSSAMTRKPKTTSTQAKSSEKRTESTKRGIGTKVTRSVKRHPIASVALGAGAGLLLVEGVRRAIGAMGNSEKPQQNDRDRREAEDQGQDSGAQGSYEDQSESDEDSDEQNADEEDDESDPQSRRQEDDSGPDANDAPRPHGVKQAAREGFTRGVQMAQRGWQEYPLALCAGALGLGVVAGMLLPSSPLEDQMMGEASDRIAGRLKKAGRTAKELAEKAYEEATETAREEAERAGLTPDQLGRKVKRLVIKVRDAVSDSVQS